MAAAKRKVGKRATAQRAATKRKPAARKKAAPPEAATAPSDSLSVRRQIFVDGVLAGKSATQACIDAGYSARSAYSQAERLTRNADVARAIAAGRKRLAEEAGVTQRSLAEHLKNLAYADPRRLMEWGGGKLRLKKSSAISDDDALLIAQVTETLGKNGRTTNITMPDRVAAARELARLLGLNEPEKRELTGKNRGPLQIEQIRGLTDDELAAEIARVEGES